MRRLGGSAAGLRPRYFTRFPPFTTNTTSRITAMSFSGSPRTAITSPRLPGVSVPTRLSALVKRAGQTAAA